MKMTKNEIIFSIAFTLCVVIMEVLYAVYNGNPFWYGIIWGLGLLGVGVGTIALTDFITKKWGE